MDISEFYKIFPKDQPVIEFIKDMIKVENNSIHKSIMDMVKLWDTKLVKLRSEMNIHAIVKKIGEKCD
jgi:hypothetical protein